MFREFNQFQFEPKRKQKSRDTSGMHSRISLAGKVKRHTKLDQCELIVKVKFSPKFGILHSTVTKIYATSRNLLELHPILK